SAYPSSPSCPPGDKIFRSRHGTSENPLAAARRCQMFDSMMSNRAIVLHRRRRWTAQATIDTLRRFVSSCLSPCAGSNENVSQRIGDQILIGVSRGGYFALV